MEELKIRIPSYRWTDKHGNPVRHGSYVDYEREKLSAINGPEGVTGWVLQEYIPAEDDFCLCMYVNDENNHLHFTGLYWVFDGEPLYDLEVNS